MQSIYEHALTPGVAVERPPGIMTVFCGAALLGRFGFYWLEDFELEDAALFRATQLSGWSFVDRRLLLCYVAVEYNGALDTYRYDPDNLIFKRL